MYLKIPVIRATSLALKHAMLHEGLFHPLGFVTVVQMKALEYPSIYEKTLVGVILTFTVQPISDVI